MAARPKFKNLRFQMIGNTHFDRNPQLSACVRAMVASGERYADGNLLFSRVQYLYWKAARELGRPD